MKGWDTVDYKDCGKQYFYILLGFCPLSIPWHMNSYLLGSVHIFTIKNISDLGHAVKSAEGRKEVVGTPFNSITSREEAHTACQPAHPGRGKDY